MERFEGDSVAEDVAYQAAKDAGMRYCVMGNDGKTATTYYATWQHAYYGAQRANADAKRDDKFWIEAI